MQKTQSTPKMEKNRKTQPQTPRECDISIQIFGHHNHYCRIILQGWRCGVRALASQNVALHKHTVDLQDNLNNNSISCFQYADDTTLYKQSTVNELVQNVADFNNSLRNMASWSNKSNLALNPVKTKQMVLSTNQLARVHDLNNQTTQLEISNRQLERVSETKLLGVKLQENLKWNDHVKDVANASYGVLRTLRKLKHFTNFNLRKRLAELLVLSRLDY